MTSRSLTTIAIALWIAACATVGEFRGEKTVDAPVAPVDRYALRFVGQRTLEHRSQFGGTTVGGLSGIDYDAESDLYYLISDDRSGFAPTRFYTARLAIDSDGFHDVALQTVVTLRMPAGGTFPAGAADAESIRYDRWTGDLWWTSEGAPPWIDPSVRRSALDGRYFGEVPLDPMFRFSAARGPRDNLAFEGASLSVDGRSLWIAMEGPLRQDGPVPTMDEGAWVRFSRHDSRHDRAVDARANGGFGAANAQFAYRVDPIPSAGAWTSLVAQTGVSEILAIDETHLLVVERALVIGAGWRIRLFEADLDGATNVKEIDSLAASSRISADGAAAFVPMKKRLVLDFDDVGTRIDSIEGLCFGPTLANGHRTLVFVSDDNFNPGQTTQFLVFEIVPR